MKFETDAIREAWWQSQANEHSQALFLTSSYTFASAADAAAIFCEQKQAYSYSRFANPTVEMFEKRLNHLEGGTRCIATATGMAAILSVALHVLKQGDHVLCARDCFGSTLVLFTQTLAKFGIEVTLVNLDDLSAWEAAITPRTRMFFLETPSNPLLTLVDLKALSALAQQHGIKVVVDNCLATPYLQQPLRDGADFVVHSATKYLDGQGRIMGGAVIAREADEGEALYRLLRGIGTTMGAFEAWVCVKSLETLALRMERHCENALKVAQFLSTQAQVEQVFYPYLASHAQYDLAQKQMPRGGGGMVSFRVHGGRDEAWRVIDNVGAAISISGNLGDARSIITHPDTTTHWRVSPENKALVGITPNLIRLSVGLEHADDICAALARGLSAS